MLKLPITDHEHFGNLFFLYFPNFSHSKTEKDSVKTANTACHVILNDNVINVSGLYITPSW